MLVLFMVPDAYSGRGGVQAYMRRLAEILSEFAAGHDAVLDCVSLADSERRLEDHPHGVSFGTFAGANGSKAIFAREAAKLAVKRPDVVVVGHVGLTPIALGLHLAGLIPAYTVVLHGWEAWERLDTLGRMAAGRAVRLVSTTDYTGREFCRLNNIPIARTCTIPLAVPDGAVAEGQPSGDRGAALKVLTVGRLVRGARYKGIDTLIEAVATLRDREVPIRLVVAGDGDDLPRLRRHVSQLELDECVRFTGAVADDDLRRLYRDCDVFALPSKREGFGIVFLEAMASSKPAIGGNHGGTPEVIEDGRDGFLVDHGDVEGLADRLLTLARNPDLAKQMGERARRKVQERFLFSHMRERWFSLLEYAKSEADLARGALPRAKGA